MDLQEIKQRVREMEAQLGDNVYVQYITVEANGRKLQVALTDRLRKQCRKGKQWLSKPFLSTLRNVSYGFDPAKARSASGQDGIFLIDRDYTPANEMMKKIFGRYLDKPGSGVEKIAAELGMEKSDLKAVRVVSHHLRLLGVLAEKPEEDWLVLLDFDDTKR